MEVDGTRSELYSTAGFGTTDIEFSSATTIEITNYLVSNYVNSHI
jgi:hypothetical protein